MFVRRGGVVGWGVGKTNLHQCPLDLSVRTRSFRESPSSDRINLVHEDNTRLVLLRVGEHLSDDSRRLSDVLVNDLEGRSGLISGLAVGQERGRMELTAEETTLRKLVFIVAAVARARRVFPVPGGP